jgi:hypothetical protein
MSPEELPIQLSARSLHDLLFGLAGRVSDDDLAILRNHLADGELSDLAHLMAELIGSGMVALIPAEVELIRRILAHDQLYSNLADRAPRIEEAMPLYSFTQRRGIGVPTASGLGGFGGDSLPLSLMDAADMAAAESSARVGGVIALWRVFRHATDGLVARVYLCETRVSADVVEMVAEMQYALAEAGEDPPRVEVFAEGTHLPVYHDEALAAAVLVWAVEGTPVRLARVFDGADADGPFFFPDHPQLADEQRDLVLAYLRAGERVLDIPGTLDDIVETTRVAAVPLAFRSDGEWVWTEAATYYLEQHYLEPEPELTRHALAAGVPRPLNRLDRHRALAVLFAPAEEEWVWQAGTANGGWLPGTARPT